MKIKVTNIQYDLEGSVPPHQVKEVLASLPKEIIVETLANYASDEELEAFVSDSITDETDFCHKGFQMEIIEDDNDKMTQDFLNELTDLLTDNCALWGSMFMCGAMNQQHPLYPEVKKIKDRCDAMRDKIAEFKK